MTLPEAHTFLRKTFGARVPIKIDGYMSLAMNRAIIDMNSLEAVLHEKHGNYEKSGLSMEGVLRKNYGEEVLAKMKDLLGI